MAEATWGEPEQEKRASQVDLGLKSLEDGIGRVENHARRLMERAAQFSIPAEPGPDSNVKAVDPLMSPMAAILHSQASRLRDLADQLADAVHRLDL